MVDCVRNLTGRSLLQLVQPSEATQTMLRDVHTEAYLASINSSSYKMAEVNVP